MFGVVGIIKRMNFFFSEKKKESNVDYVFMTIYRD